MTPKLTPNQQEINNILKSMGYKTFSYSEYKIDQLAIKLLMLYEKKLELNSNIFAETNFRLFIYRELDGRRLNDTSIDIDTESELLAIKIFFGIENESLAAKILNAEHLIYSYNLEQDENGVYSFDSQMEQKKSKLIKYCKELNILFEQYRFDENTIGKTPKSKKQFIASLEAKLKEPLMLHCDLYKKYTYFLKQNHGINQKNTLKANYLLELQFDNIDTFDIAQNIIKFSNLFR